MTKWAISGHFSPSPKDSIDFIELIGRLQRPPKAEVTGSNPVGCAIFFLFIFNCLRVFC